MFKSLFTSFPKVLRGGNKWRTAGWGNPRCALLHLCIFVEAHFLDKSLYARIYGNDVLLHLSIFGKFHVAEVHKFCAPQNDSALKNASIGIDLKLHIGFRKLGFSNDDTKTKSGNPRRLPLLY